MKYVLYGALALAALVGLGWLLETNNLMRTSFFAPRYEAVRRETFESSRAFQQGQIQNLRNMQRDYITAPPEGKAGLASVILTEADRMPDQDYPADLRAFVTCLRQHQGDGFDCSPSAAN